VVDGPGGGGKIPVMPNYVLSTSPSRTVLRNYEGVITTYTEPDEYEDRCDCEMCAETRSREGVASLLMGKQLAIEPKQLERRERASKH
jgi:lysine 2,3-aminomutase